MTIQTMLHHASQSQHAFVSGIPGDRQLLERQAMYMYPPAASAQVVENSQQYARAAALKTAAAAMYQLLKTPSALADQFKDLQALDAVCNRPVDEGSKPENHRRNRYHNVLPYDSNRYLLQDRDAYINASVVQIHSQGLAPCRYICSQGPLIDTTADFWQMVWESASPAIVMLTALTERGVEKCAVYFPIEEGAGVRAGDFLIRNHRTVNFTADIECRQLSIMSTRSGAMRKLYHILYSAWPDDGVPQDTHGVRILSGLLQPYKRLQRSVTVHCSAGIGRTGTFCAIDALLHRLRQLPQEGLTEAQVRWFLDVPAVVFQLRQQRMGMVQTPQQYVYCYLTLLEAAQHMAGQVDLVG